MNFIILFTFLFNTILKLMKSTKLIRPKEVLIYDEYVQYHDKFTEIYPKACVLMQCGDFFEIYGKESETEKLGDIHALAEACNNIAVGDAKSGWLMAGFGIAYVDKYISYLLSNHYTVILVEQVATSGPPKKGKKKERKVTKIITNSTFIDDVNLTASNVKSKNKILAAIYIEFKPNLHAECNILAISIAAIDLSIGKTSLYTRSTSNIDKELCIDECFRFIHSISPIEIIFYIEKEIELSQIDKYIDCFNIEKLTSAPHKKIIPKEYLKMPYIQSFLGKFFDSGSLNPLEYLGLIKYQSLSIIFSLLISFAYEHDETITKNLHYPTFWENSKFLTIENNGIYQLNVIKTHNNAKSLIDVLDFTNTAFGKRLHRYRLLNPIINSKILTNRYNQIEWMLTDKRYDKFIMLLKTVMDIERLHHRIENGSIKPAHFLMLEKSYVSTLKILDTFKNLILSDRSSYIISQKINDDDVDTSKLFPFWSQTVYDTFVDWCNEYRSIFNLKECHNNSIERSIFNEGIDEEIDDIQNKIISFKDEIANVASLLTSTIRQHITSFSPPKKKNMKSAETDDLIKVEKTGRDGYYFEVTNKRAEFVKKFSVAEADKIGWTNLKFSKFSNTTKITCPKLDKLNDDIKILQTSLQEKCRDLFLIKVQELHKKYKTMFVDVVTIISEIDWIVSSSKCAAIHFYCKPNIQKNSTDSTNKNTSYIQSKCMRHPLIEKHLKSEHYVPNDINIDGTTRGNILLFGPNGCGKSSLMKSVGLCVIMAQSGLYVPCTEFNYFPYKNILTRIISEDNFTKGHSSYMVEMTEMRTILNRSTCNSLVLGDELCHGTEQWSALAVITSGIEELVASGCSFMFATHLHHLNSMEEITSLKQIKLMHLKVINDEENDCLIYDRKLTDGSGNDLYGLEVAKHVFKDRPEFIERCFKIRRKLLNTPDLIMDAKPSNYCTDLIVYDCKICGKKAVDTHHINFQCTANSDGVIELEEFKFNKNKMANLVPLCKMCHIKVHHSVDGKKYVIHKYINTTKGKRLKWNEIDETHSIDKS